MVGRTNRTCLSRADTSCCNLPRKAWAVPPTRSRTASRFEFLVTGPIVAVGGRVGLLPVSFANSGVIVSADRLFDRLSDELRPAPFRRGSDLVQGFKGGVVKLDENRAHAMIISSPYIKTTPPETLTTRATSF